MGKQRKNILFICGSLNQTTMMHKISTFLPSYNCYFTHFYTTGFYKWLQDRGMMRFTIMGGYAKELADEYLRDHQLPMDPEGKQHQYDLAVTCTDLLVPDNIKDIPVILVQEGMTDPETLGFHIAKIGRRLGIPRWVGKTSTTGLSDAYSRFCVASEGYRELFIRKGVKPEKIEVTGIPNFDNAEEYLKNDIPLKGYVLIATSDIRENFGWENRRRFLRRAKEIANGRLIVVKLHPNENFTRAVQEIREELPDAKIFTEGNSHQMVANCSVLITQYSTLAYTGLALKKEVHSFFDVEELKRLLPIQNGGVSAKSIARICERSL